MLRSLVGSEMCIRDSNDIVAVSRKIHSSDERKRLQKIIEAIKPKNLGVICLLYTSDAADDLLCVDLGGRRIIKKKK